MASIEQLGKRNYMARISVKHNGKYKRVNKAGFVRKSDAQKWATEMESRKYKGSSLKYSQQSLLEYFKEWYETFKVRSISPNTQKGYKSTMRVIKKYWIDDIPLNEIKNEDYQKFINKFADSHAKSTVKKAHSQIKGAIQHAYQVHLIHDDFTNGVNITGLKSKPADNKYLEMDEIEKLTQYCLQNIKNINDVRFIMILTGLLSGSRYAETIGLTWDCIDFDKAELHIDKNYSQVDHEFGPTKNKSSKRIIPIDQVLVNALKKWHIIVQKYLLATGKKNPNNFVFLSRMGNVISNNSVNKNLKLICKNMLFKNKITFHGLRHSHASYLLASGLSMQYVSKRLGHSSLETTQSTYAHFLKKAEDTENRKALTALTNLSLKIADN